MPPEPSSPASTNTASPRQTLSYLRKLFEAYGLEAKSKLGQNFLIDINLLDVIINAADLSPTDAVLEVGTGTGSLTSKLADKAGAVVTVEIDSSLYPVARQVVGARSNVTFLQGDCLARKSILNPDMLTAWNSAFVASKCTKRKLVANLPFVIATPLISNLLINLEPGGTAPTDIERMVVMVQWEIAERLRAKPSTKDYNALSVMVQSIADVEVVRKVLPTNFFPRPKVESAIVKITPNAAKRKQVGDAVKFRAFVRDLYVHRRKNLRQALSGWPRGRREKSWVDTSLKSLDIDGSLRAETLNIEQHLRLCEVFG